MAESIDELKQAVANTARESEIINQIEFLEKFVAELRENVETLETLLKPVLTPTIPANRAEKDSNDKKETSPLAMKIKSTRDQITELNYRIYHLTNRLEV